MLSRREMFRVAGVGAVMVATPKLFATARAAEEKAAGFTLPKLPYAYDALEPHIDTETMKIHHDKHHAGYVAKLNAALEGKPEWLKQPVSDILAKLDQLPDDIRTAVRNNGGGHYNHSLFWQVMAKDGGGTPTGDLLKAIETSFGTFDNFKKEFASAASKRFGSGWAWLVPSKEKPLVVMSSPNQDNPIMDGKSAPILGIDVWEHAYYLKYQNKRPDYVQAWFNVVNWKQVAEYYNAVLKG